MAELIALPTEAIIRRGSHDSFQDGACALEWVSYLDHQAHSDNPNNVSAPLRSFVLSWNDAMRTDVDRDRLLRGVIPRLINSASTPAVEERRSYLALDWLIRVQTPTWLSLSPALDAHAATLRNLDPVLSLERAKLAGPKVRAAKDAAMAAALDAARDAAWAAAWDAAWDAAWAAARDAARAAARDAAWAALQPTVTMLEQSALDLIDRMLAVTPESL